MTRMHVLKVQVSVLLLSWLACGAAVAGEPELASIPGTTVSELLQKSYEEMLSGKFEQAMKNQIVAVKADRNNLTARRYLGYSLLRLGLPDKALEQLQFVIDGSTLTPVDMCIFGEASFECGKLSLAQSWFEKALALDPTMEFARVGLRNVTAARASYETQMLGEQTLKFKPNYQNELVTEPSKAVPSADGATIRTILPLGHNQTTNAWDNYKGTQKK